MKSASILFIAAAAGVGALSVPRDAHALGPVDLEIGARIGGASSPVSGGLNPLGFGMGARAGVSLFSFYGGLSFMYYFGGGQDVSTGGAAPPFHYSVTSTLFGFDLGYNIGIPLITLRPQLGIGNYSGNGTGSGPGFSIPGSANNLYLEPGVTGILSLGMWFVGADANFLFLPGLDNSQAAFTAHGQGGIKF
ncbi:MAG TPA: hypothetical protein VGY54_27790 [Polyangiaceae bacterium]|jgi:hypothetical protein|nr:hypothetical protein [Polyangiaceae bacterium]